ncbi:MAG: CopG family transcriptional regulator [Chloroflexi bacterium]|nr:MAG: CopG family transcriptional regulator [Chloroflexota bacterium]
MKTVISIDERLLEEMSNIARELAISRNQFISLALEDFIKRYRNNQLLKQVNAAYSDSPDADEIGILEVIRSKRRKLLEN